MRYPLVTFLNATGEKLKNLDLGRTNITLSGVGALTTRFPQLKVLSLEACRHLSEAGVISLLNLAGAELETLRLGSTNLSLTDLRSLTTDLPRLAVLDLSHCPNILERGLVSVVKKTSGSLKTLDLSGNSVITSAIMISRFPSLNVRTDVLLLH